MFNRAKKPPKSTAAAKRSQPEKTYDHVDPSTVTAGDQPMSTDAHKSDSNMNPANPSLEVETTEPAGLSDENLAPAQEHEGGPVPEVTAEKSVQPDESGAHKTRREAHQARENAQWEEDRKESGEAKKRNGKFTPVEAKCEMQPVWRVFEADGTPAGSNDGPADNGGYWSNNPYSKDPERSAGHLAAQINERRERAGRLA